MSLKIKVCGMTEAENIRQVEQAGADFIGFIFYPKSPRCVCSVPGYLPEKSRRVGVFVNESAENIRRQADLYGLDFIQLHGHETPDFCRLLRRDGLRLIKAFPVSASHDLAPCNRYEGLCDYFLFDTRTDSHGGSGQKFDWAVLDYYRSRTPFLLSGGIQPDDAPVIRQIRHPQLAGVDLNSRFENAPGLKNATLLRQFIQELSV